MPAPAFKKIGSGSRAALKVAAPVPQHCWAITDPDPYGEIQSRIRMQDTNSRRRRGRKTKSTTRSCRRTKRKMTRTRSRTTTTRRKKICKFFNKLTL